MHPQRHRSTPPSRGRPCHKSLLFVMLISWFLWPTVLVVASAKKSSSHNFYDRLGVSKTCSPKELTKAYRKACLKHHPDKGGNEEEFKELCKAYEVLNDPEKRKLYDRYGEAGLDPSAGSFGGAGGQQHGTRQSFHFNPGTAGGTFNTEDLFRRFSQQQQRQSNGFGGDGRGGFHSFSQAGGLNIDSLFQEFMMGSAGGGFTSHGGGFASQQQQQQQRASSPQVFERPLHCSLEELATGKVKKVKIKMPNGKTRLVEVRLQKGWKAGTKIKYAATRDFPAITLVVQEKPHEDLERRGNDLVYKVPEGSLTVKIVLLDGEVWERRLPRTLRKGEHITIADKGMPIKGGPARGNLILEFM
eukprot:scaffold768_cov166-Amphora_coffeaeformis.AAC.32